MQQRMATALGLLLIVGIGLVVLGFGAAGMSYKRVTQPLAFNHKLHVDTGLECVDCHRYFDTQTFSGLPTVEDCMDCHDEALTSSPEEEKIRVAAAAGEELAWNRLYEMPDHVYYSHRRHVAAGGLECATCHGPIAETTEPPTRPLRTISMAFCMDCHQQNAITEDCLACHK